MAGRPRLGREFTAAAVAPFTLADPVLKNSSRQYQNDFVTFHDSRDPGTTQRYPLFVEDRDIIIDDVWIRIEARDSSQALTVRLIKVIEGSAITANVDVTDTLGVGTGGGTISAQTLTYFTFPTSGGVPTENLVLAGQLVAVEFSAAPDASVGEVTIGIRYRDARVGQ
jgi:hypothetical protein